MSRLFPPICFNYAQMLPRGKFIVLQGLDRSGKTSLSSFIEQHLDARRPTVRMGFPDRTTAVGRMINDFLSNKEEICNQAIHLLFSANRYENLKKINDTLAAGKSIICDRYWYSGVAYSLAKGMDLEWCLSADRKLLQPDLVIYLDCEPQVLSQRANYGEERFEKVQFQKKVAASFTLVFERQKMSQLRVVKVGDKSLEDVKEEVRQLIETELQ